MMKRTVVFAALVGVSACLPPVDTVLLTPGVGGGGGDVGVGGGDESFPPDFFDGGCDFGEVDMSPAMQPASEPPAISGGTMFVAADGTAVIGDSDRDLVYVVGATSTTPLVTSLSLHDEPGRVIAGPTGRAFVTLRGAGQVAEINLANGALVARHDACPAPRGIAFDGATLYVACSAGDLLELKYSPTGITARTSVHVGDDLRDVVLVPDGLLVSSFRSTVVYKVATGGTVTTWTVPAAPDGFSPRVAWRMVAGPTGVVMVHQAELSTALPDSTCSAYGSSGTGTGVVTTRVTLVSDTQQQPAAMALADVSSGAVLPVDVAVSPDGQQVAIASAGNGQIVLAGPGGSSSIIEDLSGFSAGSFTSVAWFGDEVYVFSREPAQLLVWSSASQQVERTVNLSDVFIESTGHALFHSATPANVACASCHPEAGEDGHVWQLPEGTFRTPSLRGGLSGTAPFHWKGDEASMPALVQDVLVQRMSGSGQAPWRTDALMHWLDAQPVRAAPQLDSAAVARGAALFASGEVGCTACHSGALGTNNTTVAVGTDGVFQVPRLVELAYRAPFLHDGRAGTLELRFGPLGGLDAHGHTSQLTPADISDLATYLRSR